ncbi:MAG: molybdopterin-synthase adenylyltransferase MoeB [Bacteroidota bacterium]
MITSTEISFSKAELERYSRHLIIPDFNIEGQRKLKAAKVLVVGGGGLGSPMLQYLAAAGVGTIGIVDYDVVDDSNLQRQVLYGLDSIGKLKVEEAKARLLSQNPHITINTHNTLLNSDNALDIIKDYDVVADGTDNFPTRYLVNDACVLLGKTNVYASIFQFEGQVSVFNYTDAEGNTGPNYRDLFPTPPPPGLVPSCAEGGVIGVLPGIIGSLQALEVIKVVSGVGEPLAGRLFLFDALSFTTRILKVHKDKSNPLTGENPTQTELIDYVQFCGVPAVEGATLERPDKDLKRKTVHDLVNYREQGVDFQLIDVREPYEYEIVNIQGELMPQGEIENFLGNIDRQKPVIIHCRSGKRSTNVIRKLESEHGFTNLYNLEGGVLAYVDEIDNSLPKY